MHRKFLSEVIEKRSVRRHPGDPPRVVLKQSPTGLMGPSKLFSAALLLPQKLAVFKKNQQNH
jgi:hypothetical protein